MIVNRIDMFPAIIKLMAYKGTFNKIAQVIN